MKVPHAERVMPPFTLPQLGDAQRARGPCARRSSSSSRPTRRASTRPSSVPQLVAAVRAGGGHDLLPFTGQSAALVHDIVPAAELMTRLVAETTAALAGRGVVGRDVSRRPA